MSTRKEFSVGKKSCQNKSRNSWTPKSAFHVRNTTRQELCDSLRLKTMPSSEVKQVKIVKGAPYVPFDDYWVARRKYKDQLIKEMLRDRTEKRPKSLGFDEKRWVDKENLKYVLVHPSDEASFHYLDNDYPFDYQFDPKYFYLNYNTYKDLEGKLENNLPHKKNMKFFYPLYYDYMKKGEKELKGRLGPEYSEYKRAQKHFDEGSEHFRKADAGKSKNNGEFYEKHKAGARTLSGSDANESLSTQNLSVFKTINEPAKKKKELEKSKKLSRKLEGQVLSSQKGSGTKKKSIHTKHITKPKIAEQELNLAGGLNLAGELKQLNVLTSDFESKKQRLTENRLRSEVDDLVNQFKAEKENLINKYEHEIRILRENTEKNAHILTEFKLRLEHTGPYVGETEKNLNKIEAEKKTTEEDLLRVSRGEIQIKTQVDGLKEALRTKELEFNSLNQRLVAIQHEKANLNRDIDALRRNRVAMESQVSSIKAENERMASDLSNEGQSFRFEIERLTLKTEDLKRELAKEINVCELIEKKIKSSKLKKTHMKENIKSDMSHLEQLEKERLMLLEEIEILRVLPPPNVERVRERTVTVEKQVNIESDSGWEELRAARDRFQALNEELVFLQEEGKKLNGLCGMRSQELENFKMHCAEMEEELRRLDGRGRLQEDRINEQRVKEMESRLLIAKERNKKLFDHLNEAVAANERKNSETQNFITVLEERNRILEQKRIHSIRMNH